MSSGTWTNSTLTTAIQAHIASEVGHYKGKCYAWDVVNEALNDDGTYRTSVFYNTMGTSYLPIAFAAAATADPAAKLYCQCPHAAFIWLSLRFSELVSFHDCRSLGSPNANIL